MNRPSFRHLLVPAAGVAVAVGALAGIAAAAATQNPPGVRSLPAILGRTVEGATLRATNGQWSGATPRTFSYQWRRCGPAGGNCVDIAGATTNRYTLAGEDVGRTLRVRVTARNADGSATAVSPRTAVIRAAGGSTQTGPAGQIRLADGKVSVPVTSVSLPQRLVISQVAFTPNPVRSRNPFTARFRVTDTRGFVVRGALVYLLGVPYSRIQTVAEQATGTDGFVTFTLTPTAGLPLKNGFYLVTFVRARKPGDSLLAGVSTRRLVQVRLGAPA
jgi:hypothetical protein